MNNNAARVEKQKLTRPFRGKTAVTKMKKLCFIR